MFIVDRPNWAWDIKSKNISKRLGYNFETKILYERDEFGNLNSIREDDISWCDILVVYGLYQNYHYIDKKIDAKIKICQGISSCDEVNEEENENKLIEISSKVDSVFVHNKFLYNKFEDKINNLFYCPNGVNTDIFKCLDPIKENNQQLTIGFVGNSKSRNDKGLYDIIKPACDLLKDVNLKYLDLAEDKIINHEEMPEFYNSLDCYVCASRLEGTPNPCLEAAACGRPLITTKVGNMPELVDNNKNSKFSKRTINAFLSKIIDYKENRKKIIEHGKKIQEKIVSDWSWKRQVENYKYMFETICNKTTRTFQVIIIYCGEPQYEACLESVNFQTLKPEKVDIIKNVTPMAEAYNQAAKLITCDYVIILNADMVLYDNAFETMFTKIKSINDKNLFGVYYKLEDPLCGTIGNLKIFRSHIIKDFKHEDKAGHDRLYDEKLEKHGYYCKQVNKVLATHCQDASENQVFKRFLGVGKKITSFKKDHDYFKKVMKSIANKWIEENSDIAFYALLGYFTGLTKNHNEKERDFKDFGVKEWKNIEWIVEKDSKINKIKKFKFD